MAEVVNLNRARKQRARVAAEQGAAENRVRHGRTRAERSRDDLEAERRARAQEGARLDSEAPTEA